MIPNGFRTRHGEAICARSPGKRTEATQKGQPGIEDVRQRLDLLEKEVKALQRIEALEKELKAMHDAVEKLNENLKAGKTPKRD